MTCDEVSALLADADLLFNADEVTAAIHRLAEEISDELAGSRPILLCVMNGGLIFAGQLLTRLVFPLQIEYIHVSRYGQGTTGGDLVWHARPRLDLTGRAVLVLDDILDEGHTLAAIADYCLRQGACKVLLAVLVDKLHDRKVTPGFKADFTGIESVDRFLFGYV